MVNQKYSNESKLRQIDFFAKKLFYLEFTVIFNLKKNKTENI